MTHIPGAPRDTTRAAMFGGGSGGGGTTVQTTTTNNTPWNSSQLSDVFGKAKAEYDKGPYQFFPNSTVVPFSNQTESALQSTQARAQSGAPILANMQGNLNDTLSGSFLNAGNPYFSGMMDRVGSDVRQRMDSQFSGSGRYGSGAHANATASALADAGSSLAFQNYGQERQAQMQAAQMAPGAYQAQYMPDQMLAQVGAVREGKASEDLGDQIQRFNFNQSAPDEQLRRYASLVAGGNYGGQTVTQTPMYRNRTAGALGGALSGAALGQMTGLGAGYGAIGGGLLGML